MSPRLLEWEWDINIKQRLMDLGKRVMEMRYGMEWRQLGVKESELRVSSSISCNFDKNLIIFITYNVIGIKNSKTHTPKIPRIT